MPFVAVGSASRAVSARSLPDLDRSAASPNHNPFALTLGNHLTIMAMRGLRLVSRGRGYSYIMAG
jgi:hypothetical protein